NDGTGKFRVAPPGSMPVRAGDQSVRGGTGLVAVGDLNGDGWPDIVGLIAKETGMHVVQLLINNQDGTFRDASASFGTAFADYLAAGYDHQIADLTLADVNGDGIPDLIFRANPCTVWTV